MNSAIMAAPSEGMIVPEDTTLDAFVDEDGTTDEEGLGGSAEGDEPDGPRDRKEPEEPTESGGNEADPGGQAVDSTESEANLEYTDPAVIEATMVWRPDGAECTSCGSSSKRLWQDAGRLVCPDCKQWERA